MGGCIIDVKIYTTQNLKPMKPKVCCAKREVCLLPPTSCFLGGTKVFWWRKRRQQKNHRFKPSVRNCLCSHFSQIFDWAAANIKAAAAAHRYYLESKLFFVQNSKCRRSSFSCRRLAAACLAVRGQQRLCHKWRQLRFHFPENKNSARVVAFAQTCSRCRTCYARQTCSTCR